MGIKAIAVIFAMTCTGQNHSYKNINWFPEGLSLITLLNSLKARDTCFIYSQRIISFEENLLINGSWLSDF